MLSATDHNNNPRTNPEFELQDLRLPEQTEMSLAFRDGCLHLYNPQCGTWMSVNELHPDKKVYLYNALATNISSQLKDVVSTVKRQLNLSKCTITAFEFLSGITLEPHELVTVDEKDVYANAFYSVKEELSKFDGLHDDLDKYYQKLASNSDKEVRPSSIEINMNERQKSRTILEDKIFISVPWDWDSTFLTSKEFPAFSDMAAKAKHDQTTTGAVNPSTGIGKLFKKKQDRPPMEPTWITSSEISSRSYADTMSDPGLGIPCIVLRKLGLCYGSNGEQFDDFELVTGNQFKGDEDLMNYLLPTGSPDMIKKSHIASPIAFRYLALQQAQKFGDLTEEIDSPRLLELGTIFQAIKGLTSGCLNSINKTDQWMLRTLKLLDTLNDESVFQRAIQNVHQFGNYEQTLTLKNGVERINDQADALRLIAVTGSEAISGLLKLFHTITTRLNILVSVGKNAREGGLSATFKKMLLGKCELHGDDPIRLHYEEWHRSASTVSTLAALDATKTGTGGMLLQLQEAYQHVGSALLTSISNPVDGVKLKFDVCAEAICALIILAENLASQGYVYHDWLVKELYNTLEETKAAIGALQQSVHRIINCFEVLQNNTGSALSAVQEITAIRKKEYEKLKKREERGFRCFNFFKKGSK